MMKPGSRLGRGGARGAAFWSGRMHGRRKQRLLGARPNERAAARTATSGNERRARTCSSVVLALSSAPIWAHSSALVALWWRALGRQERPTGRCSWAARAPGHWLATGWPPLAAGQAPLGSRHSKLWINKHTKARAKWAPKQEGDKFSAHSSRVFKHIEHSLGPAMMGRQLSSGMGPNECLKLMG